MPRSKQIRPCLVIDSKEDEVLADYCQNPPHPYHTTAELVRLALESFFLPLAAQSAGMEKDVVVELAIAAVSRLQAQIEEIARKCGLGRTQRNEAPVYSFVGEGMNSVASKEVAAMPSEVSEEKVSHPSWEAQDPYGM
jgi:cobalamin-dependent methionine synthase I